MPDPYPYPTVRHLSEYPYTVGRVLPGHQFNESSPAAQAVRATTLHSIISFVKTGKLSAEGLCIESGTRSCGEGEWVQSAASRLEFWCKLSAAYDFPSCGASPTPRESACHQLNTRRGTARTV